MTKKQPAGNKAPNPKSHKETLKHAGKLRGKTDKVICPTCNGSGMRGARVCPLCDGDKVIEAHR